MNTNKPLAEIVQNYFEDNNLIDIKGTFLEAGAFDGIYQSNTLFLEKYGWKGVLVEPSFENYLKCLINRPNTISVNSALVSLEDYKNSKIMKTLRQRKIMGCQLMRMSKSHIKYIFNELDLELPNGKHGKQENLVKMLIEHYYELY